MPGLVNQWSGWYGLSWVMSGRVRDSLKILCILRLLAFSSSPLGTELHQSVSLPIYFTPFMSRSFKHQRMTWERNKVRGEIKILHAIAHNPPKVRDAIGFPHNFSRRVSFNKQMQGMLVVSSMSHTSYFLMMNMWKGVRQEAAFLFLGWAIKDSVKWQIWLSIPTGTVGISSIVIVTINTNKSATSLSDNY